MSHRFRISPAPLVALAVGLALGIAVSMTGSVWAQRTTPASAPPIAATSGDLSADERRRIAEVLARIKRDYVQRIDSAELIDNALRGMVAGLDDYSAYLDAAEYDEVLETARGSYPGVGIEVAAEREGIKVLRPIEDSPADRAGIRAGDVIVRIDGNAVEQDVDAAIEQMRGAPGTQVKLTLRRPGAVHAVDVALERARVEVHSVATAMLEGGVGYLRISTFQDSTGADVTRALRELSASQPGGLRGLVIDLRNNPGGVLEAAVETADAFLERGLIVTASGRGAEAQFRMEATAGDALDGAPIAVLVNGGSASAAEILAGALQDNGRATLIGRRTYGKGSVQTVIPLHDGRALKLTTSLYATPAGHVIDQHGIDPDVVASGPEQAPADSGVRNPHQLAQQDRDVRLALNVLRRRVTAWN
jgi:carboxyl-terminal processing protease